MFSYIYFQVQEVKLNYYYFILFDTTIFII